MMDRNEFLQLLAEHRQEQDAVVFTMSPYNFWPSYSPSPLNFFVAGAMGFASSVALGVAIAQPQRRVWVLDGDGSLLMNLGTLVTVAQRDPENFVHFVFDNGNYELVGHVPVPASDRYSATAVAAAAGYRRTYDLDDLDEARRVLPEILDGKGTVLVNVKVGRAPGKTVPGLKVFGDASDAVRAFRSAAGVTG